MTREESSESSLVFPSHSSHPKSTLVIPCNLSSRLVIPVIPSHPYSSLAKPRHPSHPYSSLLGITGMTRDDLRMTRDDWDDKGCLGITANHKG